MSKLNTEQELIFQKYKNGENIFVTGPAGSGKSFLIKTIVNDSVENDYKLQVCALTGCASILLNCKATTLHRFAGIGLANKSIDEVVEDVFEKRYKLKKWYDLKCLIIDEVSMMSLKILLILDKMARKIYRKPTLPFGGLQVIFSGDFYQLPPIKSNDADEESSMFCFEHPIWNELFPKDNQILLKSIFRQEETEFLKVLKYVREGRITKSTRETLEKRVFTEEELDKVRKENVVTIISPYKKDTDNINAAAYKNLSNDVEKKMYSIKYLKSSRKSDGAVESAVNNLLIESNASLKSDYEFLANNIMANKTLELKIGTHVMCIANISLESEIQLANGSQGIIVGFVDGLPKVKFNNITEPIVVDYFIWNSEVNKNVAVSQIPLIYAWAITIHKSQGLSLDAAIMNIGKNIFEYGQTYVALSRVRSLNGLYLSSFDYRKICANPKVKAFYKADQ
jgi:ATP-dependent DNA helicase PIF1